LYSFVPHKMLPSGRAQWRDLREKNASATPNGKSRASGKVSSGK
jgi:hypothetical protein